MYNNSRLHHRALTLICAITVFAFCLLPMQANAADSSVPSWQGVWEGTLGKSKVTVCLAAHGKSAYKYQRYQADIPLSQHGDEWEESVNGVVSGVWRLSEAQGDELEGNWQNPKSQRTLPVRLKKTADANSSAPCESRAYKSGMSVGASAANAPNAAANVITGGAIRPEYAYVANGIAGTVSAYRINAITGALTEIPGSPFVAGVGPISVTINPANTFAYVANGGGTISAYRINSTTGALTQIAGSPFKLGGVPIFVTVNPAGTFVYVATNNGAISVFSINVSTGALTSIADSPVKLDGEPISVTVNHAGTFAYIAQYVARYADEDGLQNGRVSNVLVYCINQTTGALISIAGNPFAEGRNLSSVTINPAGTFFYVLNNGGVSAYCINQTTGALTEVTGSPFAASYDSQSVTINPAGTIAYVPSFYGKSISAYRINQTTGALTPISGIPFAAKPYIQSISINTTGTFAYVPNHDDKTISIYRINQSTGALIPIADSLFVAGMRADSISAANKSKLNAGISISKTSTRVSESRLNYVYVADSEYDNSVSGYSINPHTGEINSITGSPFAAEVGSKYVTINPAGTFAYVANFGTFGDNSVAGNIMAYRINPTSGALTPVAVTPLASDGTATSEMNPSSITISPPGNFAYVTHSLSNKISAYRIDIATGALTEVAGSPLPAGVSPTSLAVNPSGTFAYVGNSISKNISAYRVNANTGAIHPVAGSPFIVGMAPKFISFNPAGTLVYVVNSDSFGANSINGNITVYRINTTTGVLTEIAGSPFPAGGDPRYIAINPAGTFAYVVNYDSHNISAYRINATTGALAEVADSPFEVVGWPVSITVNSLGTLVYVVNYADKNVAGNNIYDDYANVTTFSINPTTGSLAFTGNSFLAPYTHSVVIVTPCFQTVN